MTIHRHDAARGQKLWAFIKGRPVELVFEGLRPYAGFYARSDSLPEDLRDDEGARITEILTEPLFDDTRVGLLCAKTLILQSKIRELEAEIRELERL